MIWIILALVILVIAAMFGAPFLDFLAPNDHVYLLQYQSETEKSVILAQGAATLWSQWQNWAYIALFCLILCLIGSMINSMFREKTNQSIKQKKDTLDAKIKEQQTLNKSYRAKVEQEALEALENEYREQSQIGEQLQQERLINENIKNRASTLNKKTNISNKKQERSNRSKLAQRDRLSDQKKLLVNYLEHSGWRWSSGEKVTYQSLLREANKLEKTR